MKEIKNTLATVQKVILAILGGVFMPILIWFALCVALLQKRQGKNAKATIPTWREIPAGRID